jgi:hypothetical protein
MVLKNKFYFSKSSVKINSHSKPPAVEELNISKGKCNLN